MLPSSRCADPSAAAPCDGCGYRLPADAPEGLCPACLIRLAWGSGLSSEADDASDAGNSDDTPFRLPAGRRPVPAGPAAPSPETIDIDRYVGLAPHARGGLGEVFTATDTELHRVVALKRLQDRRANDVSSQRRFLLEAEVTARLEHPGVVPVHSLFRDGSGSPCYSMRFIQGQTLADALRAYHAGLPDSVAFRRLLQSFITVCETIAYAHSRGVIHRDLKPQNIMLGQFGETLVVDWGLAKVVGRSDEARSTLPEATLRPAGAENGDQTEMGSAVGTPAYMSPEQAAGRWDVINAVSDVYALGAVLYTLLTGRPPLEKGNWPEMQQKIQRGDFARPRAVKPSTSRALEAVCLKAMAMKPEDRYPSAAELAAEVEQWLADEPVRAYREPVAKRLGRWARRHKDLVAVAIFAVALVVGGRMYMLERDKANRQTMRLYGEFYAANREGNRFLQLQHQALNDEIRATLDGIAARVSQDARWQRPELQTVRGELLRTTTEFWDRAIQSHDVQGGETWRVPYFRVQRALCLARLGEHERAAEGVKGVWASSDTAEPPREAVYDLARVYAVCAAAAKDDRVLSGRYADRAIGLLRRAAADGVFREHVQAERLQTDPELAVLRGRGDFGRLLRSVMARPE